MNRAITCTAIVACVAALAAGWTGFTRSSAADAGSGASEARAVVFDYANDRVLIDGVPAATRYPMTNKDGRIYVAARQIADAFGLTAEYDEKSYDAVLRDDDMILQVNAQAQSAWANDVPVPFEGLGYVHEGRLLLSIRAIADYFGLYVGYDAATRQAIVAEPHYPFVAPADSSRPNVVPIDFKPYLNYRVAEVEASVASGRTLLFSDSPETFRQTGVLYRDTVEGEARIFWTHVNGTGEPAKVVVVAENETDEAVTATVGKAGIAPISKHYAYQGKEALVRWHGDADEERIVVPPRGAVALYESGVMAIDDGVHGIVDLAADGPIRLTVVAAPPFASLADAVDSPPAARDIHDRGTFAAAEIRLRTDARTWDPSTPTRIKIGVAGSLSGHWFEGVDAMTGEPSQNFGNYGVFYRLTIDRPGKAVYVLVPLRGLYMGAASFDGDVVATEALRVGDGAVLGRTNGDEPSVELVLSAASGSFMPFDVVAVPLP